MLDLCFKHLVINTTSYLRVLFNDLQELLESTPFPSLWALMDE